MTNNKIDMIMARNGIDGWSEVNETGNLDALTKTFEFSSHEQATAFVQTVSLHAEELDHHPEWSTDCDGTVIHAKLTSHFANNTVTLNDFQMAELMNQSYNDTQSTFKMFRRIDDKQMLSLCVGVGTFVLLYSAFNWVTMTEHLTAEQRGKPLSNNTDAIVDKNYESLKIKADDIAAAGGVDAYVEANLGTYRG